MSGSTLQEPPRTGAGTEPAVVGVFASHEAAERAVRELQRAGFAMDRLSIVGRGYHTEDVPVGFFNTGDRVKLWGKYGSFWGTVFGILLAPAFIFIPVVGHLLVLGPLASMLAGAIGGGAVGGGASALAGALYGIGIPKDSVVAYEEAIRADKFLLVAHGTAGEIARAEEVLRGQDAESVDTFNS
ncbi:MAG TPA: hypothetical protein VF615_02395 [Longimicrobiaceae bacterium]|jgi:hypothetical protein